MSGSLAGWDPRSRYESTRQVLERFLQRAESPRSRGSGQNGGAPRLEQVQAVAVDASQEKDPEFIVHRVTRDDTLSGLELRYGICASQIKRLNGMCSDRLTSHLELKIPMGGQGGTGFIPPKREEEDVTVEELSNSVLYSIFAAHYPDIIPEQIKYYLDENYGMLGPALRHLKVDRDWEEDNLHLLESRRHPAVVEPRNDRNGWSLSRIYQRFWGSSSSSSSSSFQKERSVKPVQGQEGNMRGTATHKLKHQPQDQNENLLWPEGGSKTLETPLLL